MEHARGRKVGRRAWDQKYMALGDVLHVRVGEHNATRNASAPYA